MRSRIIKPSFFINEDLAACDPLARILFAGLWCLADADGRLEDRPARIRAMVMPFDEANVDGLLSILHNRGFIYRYEVDGKRYLEITSWEKHAKPHANEKSEGFPAPQESGNFPNDSGNYPPLLIPTLSPSSTLTLSPDAGRASVNKKRNDSAPAEGFEEFWALYPKRKAKPEAMKAWAKLHPTPELRQRILEALNAQRASDEWTRESGRYIPHASTYLNQRRWEDELPDVSSSSDAVVDALLQTQEAACRS